jgi:hypothetical protein
MKRWITICFVLLMSYQMQAQFAYKTGFTELVRFNGVRKLSGWHLEPGMTYTLTSLRNYTDNVALDSNQTYTAEWDPAGKIRGYFGLGRHHILPYMRFLQYLDYGIHWKWLAGAEKFDGVLTDQVLGETLDTDEGEGKFSSHHLGAYFNISNVWQISARHFIQNSIGLNFDFRFLGKVNHSGASPYHEQIDVPRFLLQPHYKLGFGFKINDGFFIIPALETPILSILPWQKGRAAFDTFNSRYRPVMLTVRFAFLGKNSGAGCNTPNVSNDERKKQDQFFQER